MKRQNRPFERPHRITWGHGEVRTSSDGRFTVGRARGGWTVKDLTPGVLLGEQWARSPAAAQRLAEQVLEAEAQRAPATPGRATGAE